MDDPTKGLYVRAMVLCRQVRPNRNAFDLFRVVARIGPVPRVPTSQELACWVAFERNGERERHALRLLLLDPSGAVVSMLKNDTIPGDSRGDSVHATFDVLLHLPTATSGIHRLVLEIDGRVAAFCPLEIILGE